MVCSNNSAAHMVLAMCAALTQLHKDSRRAHTVYMRRQPCGNGRATSQVASSAAWERGGNTQHPAGAGAPGLWHACKRSAGSAHGRNSGTSPTRRLGQRRADAAHGWRQAAALLRPPAPHRWLEWRLGTRR
jgi:hypothetical protein